MEGKINEMFDLQRFGKFVKMEWKDGWKKCRLMLSVLLAVYLLVALWHYATGTSLESPDRNALMLAFSIVFALYLPSGLYRELTDAGRGMGRCLLPVSALEKYLSMIMISAIILPALFFVFIYGADALIAILSHKGKGFMGLSIGGGLYSFGDVVSDFLNIVLLQSLFVWGNVAFHRNKLAKTILLAAGCHIAAFSLIRFTGISMESVVVSGKGKHMFAAMFVLYKYLIPITLYVWGYMKFKNMEMR